MPAALPVVNNGLPEHLTRSDIGVGTALLMSWSSVYGADQGEIFAAIVLSVKYHPATYRGLLEYKVAIQSVPHRGLDIVVIDINSPQIKKVLKTNYLLEALFKLNAAHTK